MDRDARRPGGRGHPPVAAPAVRLAWSGRAEEDTSCPPPARLRVLRPGSPSLRLVLGDNLAALHALRRRTARAHLVYLDPPFCTGRRHAQIDRGRGPRSLRPAFDDRWPDLGAYLAALGARVRAAAELLVPEGSLVVHVDPRTSHYVKVLCDELLGRRAFASEIVWRYRRWPSRTLNFQRVHDVLLRYVRDPDARPRFRQLYEPLAPSTRAVWGEGRQLAVLDASGRRARSSATAEPSPGVPLGDVWDIGIVAPVARERTGYPTQKPEALLERLLLAITEPGDLVVDPYAGSGTTLAVAARLGRRALGIDASPVAMATCRRRLAAAGFAARVERVEPAPSPARRASRRG